MSALRHCCLWKRPQVATWFCGDLQTYQTAQIYAEYRRWYSKLRRDQLPPINSCIFSSSSYWLWWLFMWCHISSTLMLVSYFLKTIFLVPFDILFLFCFAILVIEPRSLFSRKQPQTILQQLTFTWFQSASLQLMAGLYRLPTGLILDVTW